MDELHEANWIIHDGAVRLRLPRGGVVTPTAVELFGVEFKGRNAVGGQEVKKRPSESLPALRFSRFPAEFALEITPPASDLSVPARCDVRIVHHGQSCCKFDLTANHDHLLLGDTWVPIDVNAREEVTALLRTANVAANGEIGLGQYLWFRANASPLVSFKNTPPAIAHRPPGASDSIPGLHANLYPYQSDGVAWLRRVTHEGVGCLLADEMGLGKTIQVIALIALATSHGQRPALVVAPATLLENWRRELKRFAPSLRCHVHRGTGRTGFPSSLRAYDVVLTTYDTCVRDLPMLRQIKWHLVVLDEAQAIKSPDAQRTRAVKALPRSLAIAMTGTPVENRLRDLWSILDFVAPGLLGSLAAFEASYDDTSEGALRLEPIASPLMLRRRVANVATDLPSRVDIPQPIELAPAQANEYERIRQQIIAEYGAAATLVAVTALRLYCTHPFLVTKASGDPLACSTKYERLVEILEEIVARDEKALLFTSFTQMSDILVADLSQRLQIPCLAIDGRTPVDERQARVDGFHDISGSALLVLNPKAAGTGLNITGANHVIHYNLEWNPAVEDQASARAFRRGQTRPVIVYRLFHASTIEEVVDERVSRKRELAEQAVVGVSGDAQDLADIVRAIELSPIRTDDPT